MTKIVFTIDDDTAELTMKIIGIKGKKCVPIHKVVSDDMKDILGIEEIASGVEDTPEMRETETVQQSSRLKIRS